MSGTERGYMGRVESGSVRVGDEVAVLPGGHATRIRDIRSVESQRAIARRHDNVTLFVDDPIDIARGDMLVRKDEAAVTLKIVEATLSWLDAAPLNLGRKYRLRHTTRDVRARVRRIDSRWNVDTHAADPAPATLAINDIGRVVLDLAEPIVADLYEANRSIGRFILVDEATHGTVAAGMIGQGSAAASNG